MISGQQRMKATLSTKTSPNIRFAARLAGHCCNGQQIINQQQLWCDRSLRCFYYKLSSVLLTRFSGRADGTQKPARQQAVYVVGKRFATP